MKKKTLALLFDMAEILALALLISAAVYALGFRHAQVDGGSMENTLHDGEHLITANLFYRPQRGDVVVINQYDNTRQYTEYELQVSAVPLVKRVIGVGGDTVRVTADAVYVNGERLQEDYVKGENNPPVIYTEMGETEKITVPEGYLFVMGDHRDASADSRYPEIGLIKEENIMGKVIWRLSPFGSI